MTKHTNSDRFKKSRRLFTDIVDSLQSLHEERAGKITLRRTEVHLPDVPVLSARDLVEIRERHNVSRSLFAAYLRINPRTLENWEQGRARPNAQALVLIALVRDHPDMLDRIASLK